MAPLKKELKDSSRLSFGLVSSIFLLLLLICSLLFGCKDNSFLKEESTVLPVDQDAEEIPADPEADLKLILELLELDQAEELYKKVHPESLQRYGPEQIIERHQKIHRNLGVTSVNYEQVELINEVPEQAKRIYQAKVKIQTAFGLIERKESFSLIFNPKSARWELQWRPNLIIPGLHEQGTVRVRDLIAQRGEIYDCHGELLAANATAYRLGIVPADYERSLDSDLADFLGIDEAKIEAALSASWVKDDSFVPLITKAEISPEEYARLRDFKLRVESTYSRSYPLAEAASILIGYLGQPSESDLANSEYADLKAGQLIGKAGLEALFDSKLRGKNGYQVYITGKEEVILIEEEMREGEDLHLTIDAKLQQALHEKLSQPDDSFTAVALDPKDGSIRALISTPAYRPDLFLEGISNEDYQALLEDQNLPLYNKFNALYTPGSTQKLISAIALLSDGTIDTQDRISIKGKSWQKDGSWGKYKIRRVEKIEKPLNLHDALVYSDNIFFAQMAIKEGAENYLKALDKLAIGQQFKTAYPFYRSTISSDGKLDSELLLADTAYGQGQLQLAPLDLVAVYAGLVDAVIPEPKLFQEEEFPPRAELDLKKSELATLQSAMREVVSVRYPASMERKGMEIAGKSGTAELGLDEDDKMKYNSWFVGYDQKDPRVVLALCLFNAQEHEKSYCHKIFADCLELSKTLKEQD
ncbi:MAG: penicillin-binding transpeptidase domain-containing protein [Eubacteriales bacterium]|nr:penicillin-binding transpeptidase domain-containing protein [Eubacteriales bacterium]